MSEQRYSKITSDESGAELSDSISFIDIERWLLAEELDRFIQALEAANVTDPHEYLQKEIYLYAYSGKRIPDGVLHLADSIEKSIASLDDTHLN
jgi:hypothetical protein